MIDVFMAAAIAMSSPPAQGPADTTVIYEDDPQWDCRIHGNRVCGDGNSQGVAPGFYGDPGEPVVAHWFNR